MTSSFTRGLVHRATGFVLPFMLGTVSLAYYDASSAALERAAKIRQLEAALRTESGKRLDAEEGNQDAIEAARAEGAMDLWKTQQELEKCLKGRT